MKKVIAAAQPPKREEDEIRFPVIPNLKRSEKLIKSMFLGLSMTKGFSVLEEKLDSQLCMVEEAGYTAEKAKTCRSEAKND